MDWRSKLDSDVRQYLDSQIKEAFKHRAAYSQAKNKANAQLWTAVALLAKQNFELVMKVNFLERALQDMGKETSAKKYVRPKMTKEEEEEIKKVLNKIQKA